MIKLKMNLFHRVSMLILVAISAILTIYAHLRFAHYSINSVPFLEHASSLRDNNIHPQPAYLKNIFLYLLFPIQHSVMASIWFKKILLTFGLWFRFYERYLFNASASLTLWYIFENAQPTQHVLFVIPTFLIILMQIIGGIFFIWSHYYVLGSIMLIVPLKDIISAKELVLKDYQALNNEKLIIKGTYSMCRHPLYFSSYLIVFFGFGAFTVDRLLYFLCIVFGTVIGTFFEERKMEKQLTNYKEYKRLVPNMFIPKII